MKDTSKKALRRGHNEGNIRQRTDGRWEVRLSAGIDYKTGKPRRTSTCCNTRQEAIAILQQQAHEVRTQGWRDPMSVTLGEWYEYWLDTYMKDTVKQSTYASYRSYLNKHFCVLGKILLKKLEPHTLQEFYNYKFREEYISFTLRQEVVRKCHATAAPHTAPVAARNASVWAHSQSVGIDARPAIYRPKFHAFGAFFPRKAFPAQALPGRVSPVQEKPALINTK